MKIRSNLFAAMFCAVFSLAHAETDVPLEITVVTGTRIEQPLNQSLSSTTVITAKDISDSQAPDVPTILRNVVGVEISQNGGIGKSSLMYLRGSDSTNVLVLVDGVRINSATTGMTSLDQIMLDQVDHIEVVRGNVSSLYGSEAIGGVIQIFTKHGAGAPAMNINAGMGSQGTQRLSTGVGGATEAMDFNVQVSTFKTDGAPTLNSSLVPNTNPNRDGYSNKSVSVNLGHTFDSDHRVTATLFGSNGNNQYDNAFNVNPTDANTNREQIWKFSFASDDQFTGTWHSKLQLATGVDQYRDFLNGLPTPTGSLFQTTNNQLTWQNSLHLDDSKQLLLGAESLQQNVSSDINPGYAQTTRQVNSLFAGYTGHYGANQMQLNVRQDNNSQYGTANTGLVGYGYAFTDAWRITTSYSTAFRAPTFNELYFPGGFGNAALMPEQSKNIEAGVHYSVKSGQQFDAVYFDNRIHDMIAYNANFQSVNVNQARINGFEFSYAERLGDTNVKAALTSQNPRDEISGMQLDQRSRMHSSLGVTQQLGAWQVGGEWLYSSSRVDHYTDPATFLVIPETLASYNVFNLTAGYAISKQTKLSFRADNITNQNDSNVYGYNPLGRRLFVSLSYQQ
jgi:vitamin B12 transporter